MPQLQTRKLGGPYRGFMSSVDRDRAPLDRLTGSSINVVMDPLSGSFLRRPGSQITGDNAGAPVGLLESKWGGKCRQMFELISASLTDLLGTHAYLVTDEVDNEGTIGWRDTNTNTNRQLGQDMTATHYPRSAAAVAEFIMPPLKVVPTAGNAIGMTRAVDEVQRRVMCPGSRNTLEMNDELFAGAFSGTPVRWTKRWNPTASGTEINRVRPWGHYPPAWAPEMTVDVTFDTAGGSFATGDMFYDAWSYIYADGSHSRVSQPRPSGAIHTAGYGLITVPAGGPYKRMIVNNAPIGEDGVVGRIYWRSPKVTTGVPNIRDLRLCATILDNTTTKIYITDGTDSALEPQFDKDLVNLLPGAILRDDHQWAPRARHVGRFDERACVAYVRPGPGAFVICQKSSNAGLITSNTQDTAAVTATVLSTTVRDDQAAAKVYMVLREAALENKIDLAGIQSLQDLLDTINATTAASTSYSWRAQNVPGAPVAAAPSKLEVMQVIADTITDGTTTVLPKVGQNFGNVQIGMKVSGGGLAAGTRVTSKPGANIVLSNAPAGGIPVLTIGWDYGDSVYGEMRSFSPSYLGVHYFNETFLATFPTNKRMLQMTSGGPGAARNAPNSFFADTATRKPVPASAGQIMGVASIDAGSVRAIVPCSRGIYKLVNYRGGGTGDDADYRMAPLNTRRGCIASGSIIELDGAVGYLVEDGFCITNGQNGVELIISLDLWNLGNGKGDWAYEIQQCRMGAAKDSDDEHFHAHASSGKLYLSWRDSSAVTMPNRMIEYNYTPGLANKDIQSLIAPDGQPYGWSAPWLATAGRLRPGAMCAVRKADGVHQYFYDDGNAWSTGDGRVQEFALTGTLSDDGGHYTSHAWHKCDRFDTTLKKILHAITVVYTKGIGLPLLILYRTRDRSDGITVLNFESGAEATPARAVRVEVPLSMRGISDIYEIQWTWADSTNKNGFEGFEIEADYEVVRTHINLSF